jgi:hypothetical protein
MLTDRHTRRTWPYDPERYDADLEWLHQGCARDLGEQGNLGSVISSLERGVYCAPTADVVEAMLARLSWSCRAVQRARRVLPRWRRLPLETREVLTAHYSTAGELPPRADALLGDMATVALWMASREPKGRALRALLRALERADSGYCKGPARAAEKAVRAAHMAWARTGQVEAEQWVAAGVYKPTERDWHPTVRFDARETSEGDYSPWISGVER